MGFVARHPRVGKSVVQGRLHRLYLWLFGRPAQRPWHRRDRRCIGGNGSAGTWPGPGAGAHPCEHPVPRPDRHPIFSKALGKGRDAYVSAWEQVLPVHRIGTAAEAGAATVFLMTNTFMNGATLNIDGGARLV